MGSRHILQLVNHVQNLMSNEDNAYISQGLQHSKDAQGEAFTQSPMPIYGMIIMSIDEGLGVCGISIYEGKLFVCFVLFVLMRSTKLGCFRSFLGLSGKLLRRRGASAWFHGIWTYGVEVFEY
jgi:hypothetical protein